MLLSEHVYCLAVTFKMTEWVEQQICIKFYIKLKLSSGGNYLHDSEGCNAALPRQCTHSCITSCADFLAKYQISHVNQTLYSTNLVLCDFRLFPKLKSHLKRKRFQTVNEIQENTMGQLIAIETVWGPKCYFEGDWDIIVLCSVFFVSCICFNKCLYFSYYMAGYLLGRPSFTYWVKLLWASGMYSDSNAASFFLLVNSQRRLFPLSS